MRESIREYWRVVGIIAGVAVIAFGFFADLSGTGVVSFNTAIIIGLITFVFFCILEVIKARRKAKESLNSSQRVAETTSTKQSGGQTIGVVHGNVYQQPQTPLITPRQSVVPIFSQSVDGEVLISYNDPQKDEFGNPLEFKFTISNETNTDLSKCAVYINEVAYKTRKSKQWEIVRGLPSEKTLLWDGLIFDLEGRANIDSGHRKAFTLSKAKTAKYKPRTYKYAFTFYKYSSLFSFEDSINYRILIHFHASHFLGVATDKKFYIFLQTNKYGNLDFEQLDNFLTFTT